MRFKVQFCLSLSINDLRETGAKGLHKRVYILSSGQRFTFVSLSCNAYLFGKTVPIHRLALNHWCHTREPAHAHVCISRLLRLQGLQRGVYIDSLVSTCVAITA